MKTQRLWFDVGIKRYQQWRDEYKLQDCCGLMQESKDIQPSAPYAEISAQLWFDVGIKRYTTWRLSNKDIYQLWFDVGIKRYNFLLRNRYFCSIILGWETLVIYL